MRKLKEKEILQRKILLKTQALKLIRGEIEDLAFEKALIRYQGQLAGRIKNGFDRGLSAQLDQIQILIDLMSGQALQGLTPRTPDPWGPAFSSGERNYLEKQN